MLVVEEDELKVVVLLEVVDWVVVEMLTRMELLTLVEAQELMPLEVLEL